LISATPGGRLRRSKKVRRIRGPGFESVLEKIDEEVKVKIECNVGPTRVTNIVRIGFDASCWKLGPSDSKAAVKGDLKDAWLWVEGWRARLRAGGDLVEKCRYGYEG
jgi:hypothetical protein